MKFHVALFDPSHASTGGDYWAWRDAGLPRGLLDVFYYEVAANHRPEDPNQLAIDDLHGGCAGLDDTWSCWYRFVNGGRDQRDRPGRFVILAAFMKRNDHAKNDWSGVLECPLFRDLASLALTTCPLPSPPSLEIDWDAPPISCDPVQLARSLEGKRVAFNGSDALRDAFGICAHLPSDLRFDCEFERHGITVSASLSVGKKAAPSLTSSEQSDTELASTRVSNAHEILENAAPLDPDAGLRASATQPVESWLNGPVSIQRWMLMAICAIGIIFGTIFGGVITWEFGNQRNKLVHALSSKITTPSQPSTPSVPPSGSEATPARPDDQRLATPEYQRAKGH